jgi:Protein of unknown function (DUF992)
MKKSVVALAALALLVLAAPAQARVRAGLLTCHVAPGMGYVIGSQKSISCTFKSVWGWREHYDGHITRVGFDVGYTSGGIVAWAVYAPARRAHGALAGTYAGASGEATVGLGATANVLVGGFGNSISLQPVSVGAQEGLSVAVGVSGLELEHVR